MIEWAVITPKNPLMSDRSAVHYCAFFCPLLVAAARTPVLERHRSKCPALPTGPCAIPAIESFFT